MRPIDGPRALTSHPLSLRACPKPLRCRLICVRSHFFDRMPGRLARASHTLRPSCHSNRRSSHMISHKPRPFAPSCRSLSVSWHSFDEKVCQPSLLCHFIEGLLRHFWLSSHFVVPMVCHHVPLVALPWPVESHPRRDVAQSLAFAPPCGPDHGTALPHESLHWRDGVTHWALEATEACHQAPFPGCESLRPRHRRANCGIRGRTRGQKADAGGLYPLPQPFSPAASHERETHVRYPPADHESPPPALPEQPAAR